MSEKFGMSLEEYCEKWGCIHLINDFRLAIADPRTNWTMVVENYNNEYLREEMQRKLDLEGFLYVDVDYDKDLTLRITDIQEYYDIIRMMITEKRQILS